MHALLRLFFYLLYQPLAWSYDAVAWLVSLGRWRSWVASSLSALRGQRVLELGQGPGHLQVAMRKAGYTPVGLDLSAQMGHLAARRLAAAGNAPLLVRADGRWLPFRAGAFDSVVATFPTEYVFSAQSLSEARRVLPAGGRLVLLPVAWITGGSMLERAAAWLFRITGEAPAWDERWAAAIAAAGFVVREQRVALPGSEVLLLLCERR
ncbi:MAG: methyltransferase domain-containing protein [Anaerolineales bacterium]|nr:methyltransferase domain-containing protein [Anaerolineales bacterium]MCW5887856.1 methyltransferase domain-containing protein [Anaerolineales bacterium]